MKRAATEHILHNTAPRARTLRAGVYVFGSVVSEMILTFCILSIISTASCHQSVDWSPFEVVTALEGKYSVNLIRSLPIQQYWDVQKGSFRTGLLGEDMSRQFPQYTSFVERKVIRAGKNMGVDNHIVDTASLYMCSLSAIQELADTGDELMMKQMMVNRSRSDNLGSPAELTESGGASLSELQVLSEAMSFLQSAHNSSLQRFFMDKDNKVDRTNVRKARQVAQYSLVHSALTAEIDSFLSNANDSNVQKFSALHDIVRMMESTRYSQKEQALSKQHQENVLAFRRAINLTMEALTYRAAAELSAANAQRAFEEEQLLATKSELLQAEVEKVVETFFAELSSYVLYVQSNPAVALVVLRNCLIGVFLILLCFEVGQLILLVVRKLSGTSYLPKVTRLGAKSWWGAPASSAAAHPAAPLLGSVCATGPQLLKALDALTVAVGNRLALPNLLVTGPAGSGKSSTSRTTLQHIAQVAAASNAHVSCVVLCGADLQALGNGAATGFLNDLIRRYSCQHLRRTSAWAEALVLVVDDADSIIAARSSSGGTGNSNTAHGSSMNGSLFALLTGLRENSSFVSVILTSRLPVEAVDVAILDRLDLCIELGLPRAEERLQHLLSGLAEIRNKAPGSHSETEAMSTAIWKEYDDVMLVMTSGGGLPTVAELVSGAPLVAGLDGAHRQALVIAVSQLSCEPGASGDYYVIDDGDDAASVTSSSCPEMDLPCDAAAASPASSAPPIAIAPSSRTRRRTAHTPQSSHQLSGVGIVQSEHDYDALLSLLRHCAQSFPEDDTASATPAVDRLNLSLCLLLALLVSAKWSYRDLKQFFSALNYNIMCSERCQISNRVWIQELIYSFD